MKSNKLLNNKRPVFFILTAFLVVFALVPRRQPSAVSWSRSESPRQIYTWAGFEGFSASDFVKRQTRIDLFRASGALGVRWDVGRRLDVIVASRAKPGVLLASDRQGNVLALVAAAKRIDPITTVPGWPPKFSDMHMNPSPLVADDESGSLAVQMDRRQIRVRWSNGTERAYKAKGPPGEIFFGGEYLFALLGEGTVMRYSNTGESIVFAGGIRQAQPWGRSEVLLVSHDTRANWTYLTFADAAHPDRKLKLASPGIYYEFARLADRSFASAWVPREIDWGRAVLPGLEQGDLRLCSVKNGELRTRCLRRGTYFGVELIGRQVLAFDDRSIEAIVLPKE